MQNILIATVAIFQLMSGISALQVLVALSKERLKLASLVAENKAQMCKAVEDPEREKEILQVIVKTAQDQYGLEPAFVEPFFKAQMEANKLLQYGILMDANKKNKRPSPIINLNQVRVKVDELNHEILKNLKQVHTEMQGGKCIEAVNDALESELTQSQDFLYKAALIRALSSLVDICQEKQKAAQSSKV
uniref:chorismate mutase n=1 Tax=Cacopsylla melanoneura TaxID=428564 RepID=A0A8D8V606_9HEMI